MRKIQPNVLGVAIKRYLQIKVIPLLPTSLDQFLLSGALLRFDTGFQRVLPMLERLGLMTDGLIDIDALDESIRAGFGGVKEGKIAITIPTAKSLAARLITGAAAQADAGNWVSDVLLSAVGIGQNAIEDGIPMRFSVADWDDLRALI